MSSWTQQCRHWHYSFDSVDPFFWIDHQTQTSYLVNGLQISRGPALLGECQYAQQLALAVVCGVGSVLGLVGHHQWHMLGLV